MVSSLSSRVQVSGSSCCHHSSDLSHSLSSWDSLEHSSSSILLLVAVNSGSSITGSQKLSLPILISRASQKNTMSHGNSSPKSIVSSLRIRSKKVTSSKYLHTNRLCCMTTEIHQIYFFLSLGEISWCSVFSW